MISRKLGMASLLMLGAAFAACTAEVEDEGALPTVEVTEEGRLPEIDVDPVDIDITTDTQQIVVPDIDITPTDGND